MNRYYITSTIFSFLFCIQSDTIFFKSSNPFSFKDIISPKQNSIEQNVYGVLQLPVDIDFDDKVPLVICLLYTSPSPRDPT